MAQDDGTVRVQTQPHSPARTSAARAKTSPWAAPCCTRARLGACGAGAGGQHRAGAAAVARRPRVALLSTGDELVMPGQVPPSNAAGRHLQQQPLLSARTVQRLGCELTDLGMVPDQAAPPWLRCCAKPLPGTTWCSPAAACRWARKTTSSPPCRRWAAWTCGRSPSSPAKPFACGRGAGHFWACPATRWPVSSPLPCWCAPSAAPAGVRDVAIAVHRGPCRFRLAQGRQAPRIPARAPQCRRWAGPVPAPGLGRAHFHRLG